MSTALILSSFVAANRIGGGAQQIALTALGIEAHLVPTTILGRNPARGASGQATAPELFQGMVDDVAAEGLFARIDLVITGYFASAEQVRIAAATLARLRAANSNLVTVVDPILGDHPKGLYLPAEVAASMAAALVPAADWITPNAWELAHLTGRAVESAEAAAAAARTLGGRALVSSIPAGAGEIGLVLCDGANACLYAHPRREQAPNGAGDLVTAVFAAGLVQGLTPDAAAAAATAAAAHMIDAAAEMGDLPLAQLVQALRQPVAGLRMAPFGEPA